MTEQPKTTITLPAPPKYQGKPYTLPPSHLEQLKNLAKPGCWICAKTGIPGVAKWNKNGTAATICRCVKQTIKEADARLETINRVAHEKLMKELSDAAPVDRAPDGEVPPGTVADGAASGG